MLALTAYRNYSSLRLDTLFNKICVRALIKGTYNKYCYSSVSIIFNSFVQPVFLIGALGERVRSWKGCVGQQTYQSSLWSLSTFLSPQIVKECFGNWIPFHSQIKWWEEYCIDPMLLPSTLLKLHTGSEASTTAIGSLPLSSI
jgi:hypothetical protein